MNVVFAKSLLLVFFVFFFLDYILFYMNIDFLVRRLYKKTTTYKFMRRMGFWGKLNMFCPGTRVSYFTYTIKNKNNSVVYKFPDYREICYFKQLIYYRWRKLGYSGLRKKKEIILQNFSQIYGYPKCSLHETKILMPYYFAKTRKHRRRIIFTSTHWPPKKEKND